MVNNLNLIYGEYIKKYFNDVDIKILLHPLRDTQGTGYILHNRICANNFYNAMFSQVSVSKQFSFNFLKFFNLSINKKYLKFN